jgi:electron transport complex protein RnfC
MLLTPFAIARFARTDNFEKLEPLGATACMECGCCAYACPSGIPLVQYMRLAKSMHSEQEAKK